MKITIRFQLNPSAATTKPFQCRTLLECQTVTKGLICQLDQNQKIDEGKTRWKSFSDFTEGSDKFRATFVAKFSSKILNELS